ncbi:MAG: response regulator [Thermodesulfobacteriota bacterium]
MPFRILVVDDDPTNLEVITELLEDENYTVLTADTGEAAMAALDDSIDLVILDWMLPGISGIEVLTAIKKDPVLCDIPVIMQTARAYAENVVEGLEAGACHYLTKPFTSEVLLSMVRSTLEQGSRLLNVSREANRRVEELKDSFFSLAKKQRSTRLDLTTYKQITSFFTKSLSCRDHRQLVQLLLETVKEFSFPSAGKDGSDRQLRCSIRLQSDEEVNVSDRGIDTRFDSLVLQRAMESGKILQQGSYTAIASGSRQTAILIRNTPVDKEEAMKAIEIASILLERFEERLNQFENELSLNRQKEVLEKRATQIKAVVRSCAEQLDTINATYQKMKERQMAVLEDLGDRVVTGVSGLTPAQEAAIREVLRRELLASMELYAADQITDQKFLNTIQQLNGLLADKPREDAADGGGPVLVSQEEVDALLATLGL